MDSKVEGELNADFQRWIELVDRAAHAENEVEREKPALRVAELDEKWTSAAAENWHEMRENWYETCKSKVQ
ncbi:hypothetical protein ACQP0C_27615 [Nocardia sp. CA-129566]|uniref:hypothetical protein n=1 Tax=Nocardia sp. CA-129566 TaxID=3239976 RepID=UPI003D995DA6